MKDILIDTPCAKNLSNPMNDHYKKFAVWLHKEGALTLNKKLVGEYNRGNQTLGIIIDKLIKEGRWTNITNKQIKEFDIPKKLEKKLRSNKPDRPHLISVLLSERMLCVTEDVNLNTDINAYPLIDGKQAQSVNCPSKIEYE